MTIFAENLNTMKRLAILFSLLAIFLTACTQNGKVVQFMGIPVDGSEKHMAKELQDRGFTKDTKDNFYNGNFNNKSVVLKFFSNKGEVYLVSVASVMPIDEEEVRGKYDELYSQFLHDGKYIPINGKQNIEYVIRKKDLSDADLNKIVTSFLQVPTQIAQKVTSQFTEEQLSNSRFLQSDEYVNVVKKYAASYEDNVVSYLINKDMLGFLHTVIYYENCKNEPEDTGL